MTHPVGVRQSIVPEVRGIVLAGNWNLPPELAQNCRPCLGDPPSFLGAKNKIKNEILDSKLILNKISFYLSWLTFISVMFQ